MAFSDQELIKKAKLGDKQAFTEIFNRYKDKILGFLYRYVGNYQTAEDLTVETFLNAYNCIPVYEERGMFQSWLFRLAANCAKKEFRRRDQRKEVSLEGIVVNEEDDMLLSGVIADEKMRPDHEARKRELKEFIYKVVESLEKKYQDVILLCDVEGVGYAETARILKCNPFTVGTRLKRARKILKDLLKKHGFQF